QRRARSGLFVQSLRYRKLLRDTFIPWGLEVSFVDMTDVYQTRSAVRRNTKLVFVETPSNPQIKIADLHKISEIAHEAGAYFVVC
ncbi:MAG TPA: PLP-dependent transferase, partial [Pyrinomonadaceae bacterium]|nr:PLP-dependent transferase [Pyrinomonadaceae bacterium]